MKMTYNLVVFKPTPPQSAASLRSSATIVQRPHLQIHWTTTDIEPRPHPTVLFFFDN